LLNFFLELPLLLLRGEELLRTGLKRIDGCIFVVLGSLAFLLELKDFGLRVAGTDELVALVEFVFELLQLDLVFAEEGTLVDVLVDVGLVFDMLGPICKFERLVRLVERVRRRRDHRHHRCLAITTKRVFKESSKLRISKWNVLSRFAIC